MKYIFYDGLEGIIRVVVTTIAAYIILIFMLRISGKRTLAKMNAFDFVVTIALGSILGSVILNKSVPLVEGLLAAALLIALQYCITYISVRNKTFKNFISSKPTLLLYNGELIKQALLKSRISISEINKAVRKAGIADLSKVDVIVLESTGDITVIGEIAPLNHSNSFQKSVLDDIENFPAGKKGE